MTNESRFARHGRAFGAYDGCGAAYERRRRHCAPTGELIGRSGLIHHQSSIIENMNPQSVITLGQQALYTMLLLAAPMLLAALVVGLVVSILQAATQINEMTLSFIPKLIAMVAAMVIAGPWMISFYVDYMRRMFESIPTAIG
jgi:flagellar biosynthesis protein FliQ